MKLFEYGKNLESEVEGLIGDAEEAMQESFKASGQNIIDLLDFDAKTGAAIGGCVQLYKRSKKFAIMQAQAMDRMLADLEELKDANKELRKQNEEMQHLLHDLSRSVEKLSGKVGA